MKRKIQSECVTTKQSQEPSNIKQKQDVLIKTPSYVS